MVKAVGSIGKKKALGVQEVRGYWGVGRGRSGGNRGVVLRVLAESSDVSRQRESSVWSRWLEEFALGFGLDW